MTFFFFNVDSSLVISAIVLFLKVDNMCFFLISVLCTLLEFLIIIFNISKVLGNEAIV